MGTFGFTVSMISGFEAASSVGSCKSGFRYWQRSHFGAQAGKTNLHWHYTSVINWFNPDKNLSIHISWAIQQMKELMHNSFLCRFVKACFRSLWRLKSVYGPDILKLCRYQWSSWTQSKIMFLPTLFQWMKKLKQSRQIVSLETHSLIFLLWADVCVSLCHCIVGMMRWECFSLWWLVRTHWRAASFRCAAETLPSKRPCTSLRSRTLSADTFLLQTTSDVVC